MFLAGKFECTCQGESFTLFEIKGKLAHNCNGDSFL